MLSLKNGVNFRLYLLWALLASLAVLTLSDPPRGLLIALSALAVFLFMSAMAHLKLI